MEHRKINIKPLSVNVCWQGKRFKTPKYKSYETEALYKLPILKLPKPPFMVSYVFGLSNSLSDIDNPVKPFTDILQKKYNFNDRDIMKMVIEKVKVKKGEEFIEFRIETFD